MYSCRLGPETHVNSLIFVSVISRISYATVNMYPSSLGVNDGGNATQLSDHVRHTIYAWVPQGSNDSKNLSRRAGGILTQLEKI